MPEPKSVKEKLLHEIQEVLFISLYLACFFGAVTTYRLMLPEPPAPLIAYTFGVMKALVLAKVILLVRMVSFTRAFDHHSLLAPTLFKVALFGVLAFAVETLEHLVTGMIHGKGAVEVLREATSGQGKIIVARTLVVLAAFAPFFAFTELARVLGGGQLRELFLNRRAR